MQISCVCTVACTVLLLAPVWAGEGPFFITYTHQMEEPGNLEFATKNVTGRPNSGSRFLGSAAEFEYGLQGWWTTELYLDGQVTGGQSAVFTGYRWENRFRVLPREHWINPVLYVEFENINGADKTLLEVVNHDSQDDLTALNSTARAEKKREIEAKLILGSYVKGWTITENFIAEKNVRHAPFEFGYAVGVSRPLALAARRERCNYCRENFQVGLEMYGGLGTHDDFGLRDTSQYVAPTVAWTLADGAAVRVSPGFGITGSSAPFLLRFGVSYEIAQLGRRVRNFFPGGRPGTLPQQAPERWAARQDPLDGEEGARQAGAKLYARECASCHGVHGEGVRRTPPLKRADIRQAPPGALFWVLENGSLRNGMPSFAHLPEQQRWQIVTFLRTKLE